ncbi:MAG: alanine racemase [Solobacterium sp.]|nr:alanine racemase [Solobacterium sp.]
MCPYLNRYGIKDFAVASLDEALELRRNGIIENILILGYVYHKVKIYDLTVSITSYEHTRILNDRKSGLNAIFR